MALDLELWEIGNHSTREIRLHKIKFIVQATEGEVLDEYNGPSISALRIRVNGKRVGDLLTIEDVASIDFPPEPDLATASVLEMSLPQMPLLNDIADDVPVVGIVDSGVTSHPLLKDAIVAATAEPEYPHLLRALLVGGATVPQPAAELLARVSKDTARHVCGNGLVDLEHAAYSDNNRVVLYAEDELSFDHFAVYEVPVPKEYQS